MAFVVGNKVWFKALGSTPYVRGDASDPGKAVGTGGNDLDFGASSLGGRGKPDVSKKSAAQSGLSDAQGVPTLDFDNFPPALASDDAVTNTFNAAGQHLGVRDKITDGNPLAPGTVATDGVYDGPTDKNLFNPGNDGDGSPIDDGNVDNAKKDTIRDIDPNFPSGRTTTAVAAGIAINVGGTQDFVSETIDLKTASKRVGRRLPSSEEGSGTVIEVVTVKNGGKSPDGTPVSVGSKMYWVDWGTSDVSNPHRTKWNNRMRTTLHAEADLVAA
jgi:hypothetical protein